MKLVIRPIQDPQRELDLTHRLVSAIAEELWKLYGGNEQLNWVEAELHLQRIVGEAGAEAREADVDFVAPFPSDDTKEMPDERPAPRHVGGKGAATLRRNRSKKTKHSGAVTTLAS